MDSSKKYKKLVVMTSRFPFPLEKGDKLRAYYQIKELSKYFEVHLICTSEHRVDENHLAELYPFCKSIHCYPINLFQKIGGAGWKILGKQPIQVGYFHHFGIHRKIKRLLEEIRPDHIYCQLVRAAEYVKNYHRCPKTIDYMDALSKGMERRAQNATFLKKFIFNAEYQRLLNYENSLFEYFEYHTIISEPDKEYILHKNKNAIKVIPNGVNPAFLDTQSNTEKTATIVFIGNMSYPPNIMAAEYIVKNILPEIKEPITVKIVGASPSKEVLRLQQQNVTITGFVPDIKMAYTSAEIFVAPMFIGTGLQNKLLEAMALGIPSITTSLANNALNAKPDSEILIADTPETFIQQIERLRNNPELYQEISKNAHAFIAQNYCWDVVTLPLIKIIEQ